MAVVETHQLAQEAEFTTFWIRCNRLRTSLIEHEIQVKKAKAFLHEARQGKEGTIPYAQPTVFEAAVNVLEAEVESAAKDLEQIKATVLQNEELVNAFSTHYNSLKTAQDDYIAKTLEANEELHKKQKAAEACLSKMENVVKTTRSKMQKAAEAACYANEKEANIIQAQGLHVRTLLEAFAGDSARETNNNSAERNICGSMRKGVTSLGSSIQKKTGAIKQFFVKFLDEIESGDRPIKIFHLGVSVLVVLSAGVMFCIYTDGKIDNAMTEMHADIYRIDNVMKEMHTRIDNVMKEMHTRIDNVMKEKSADIDDRIDTTVGKVVDGKIKSVREKVRLESFGAALATILTCGVLRLFF